MADPILTLTKVCTKCGREYPATVEYFYRNKEGKYGVTSACIRCARRAYVSVGVETVIQLRLPFGDASYQIPLTQGYNAIVDPIDGDLDFFKWRAQPKPQYTCYAIRSVYRNPRCVWVALHRLIMERIIGHELPNNIFVDHKDGDGLNNQRSNLRLATASQNLANARRRSDNSSGYKGVTYARTIDKWHAQIVVRGKYTNLGYFETPEEAYAVYCKAAKEYFGEFARFD